MARAAHPSRISGARLLGVAAGMLVLVAGCGTSTPDRTSPPPGSPPPADATASAPAPEVPIATPALAALAGTWTGSPAEEPADQVTIAFVACGGDDVCGTGTWMHTNRCDFTLAHTATDADVLVFTVGAARQMQCGWGGPATDTTFRVRLASDGTLELRHSAGMPAVRLSRSQGSGYGAQ